MTTAYQRSGISALAIVLTATCLLSACESGGGMSAEEIAKETNAAMDKVSKVAAGRAKLLEQLSQIPTNEQLMSAPVKETGKRFIILERETGPYQFAVPPEGDSITGEMPPIQSLVAALVQYRRQPEGEYEVVGQQRKVPGYRLDAELFLVDHAAKAVVYRKNFRGPKPQNYAGDTGNVYSNSSNEVVGAKPIRDIEKFLNELPYKK